MPLKVLLGHNYYLQPGGEDTAFSAEVRLLQTRGHEVVEYVEDNRRIQSMGRAAMAAETLWSRPSYDRLLAVLERERPDIVHFHNTFPLISPSAYDACRKAGAPVVQSLDNPRLMCPSANFYRDGHLCQDCLGKTPPWPSVVHRCYHGSAMQSAAVAWMLTAHRLRRTWETKVDLYLVATDFYRRKFIEGGIPAERIQIKPHYVYPDPGARSPEQPGAYALFVGRLDPEKGVETLLQAWAHLGGIPLKVCGDGRLHDRVRELTDQYGLTGCVQMLGRLPAVQLTELVKGARFLVWPSEGYYETFGYVAVESFSCGVPVIASRIGVQAEIVTDGVTGLHFEAGVPEDLARAVQWAWEHPAEMAHMGSRARLEYESRYSAEGNYPLLIAAYERAIDDARQREHAARPR
jgi:glycosyltransferase involved in cell wall biosynthesis